MRHLQLIKTFDYSQRNSVEQKNQYDQMIYFYKDKVRLGRLR